MAQQLIFCLETDKKARTDKVYVMETIRRFYGSLSNRIKISYIYLGGKSKYNSQSVEKEIKEKGNQYQPNGPSYVIYCIDTDQFENNPAQYNQNKQIETYCQRKGYDLIYLKRHGR